MYKIRFTNNNKITTIAIANKSALEKIIKGDAKNSIIECKIGDNMPILLHNIIAKHNLKINHSAKLLFNPRFKGISSDKEDNKS